MMRRETWDNSPMVALKERLVFCATPKVACSVWKMFLKKVAGRSDWRNDNIKPLHEDSSWTRPSGRARSHCRVAPPFIRFAPDHRRDAVPVFLKRE